MPPKKKITKEKIVSALESMGDIVIGWEITKHTFY